MLKELLVDLALECNKLIELFDSFSPLNDNHSSFLWQNCLVVRSIAYFLSPVMGEQEEHGCVLDVIKFCARLI